MMMTGTGQVAATSARCSILALTVAVGIFCSPRSAASTGTNAVEGLAKTSWQLVAIRTSNDQSATPDDGSKYTIVFGSDRRALLRADCNRGVATWHSVEDGDLEFGAARMTRIKCDDGSMGDRFLNDLGYVRSYAVEKGHLFLSLFADGGILEFAPSDH